MTDEKVIIIDDPVASHEEKLLNRLLRTIEEETGQDVSLEDRSRLQYVIRHHVEKAQRSRLKAFYEGRISDCSTSDVVIKALTVRTREDINDNIN